MLNTLSKNQKGSSPQKSTRGVAGPDAADEKVNRTQIYLSGLHYTELSHKVDMKSKSALASSNGVPRNNIDNIWQFVKSDDVAAFDETIKACQVNEQVELIRYNQGWTVVY
jgi:hypothetical protein